MNLIEAYARGVAELSRYVGSSHLRAETVVDDNRSLAAGTPVRVDVVVNPHAGFFRKQRTVRGILRELNQRLERLHEKLLVVTLEGRVYAFGQSRPSEVHSHQPETKPLASRASRRSDSSTGRPSTRRMIRSPPRPRGSR